MRSPQPNIRRKYRLKPVEVEAEMVCAATLESTLLWIIEGGGDACTANDAVYGECIVIRHEDGEMLARPGAMILNEDGFFFPMPRDEFEACYEDA